MPFPTHIVAAAGYVFDKNDNILLIKTQNRGWDCTGGQIEVGENVEEGVLREVLEESGIIASVKSLCGIYSNVGKHLYYDGETEVPTKLIMDFICEYESGECRTSVESSEVKWVPRSEVWDYIEGPVQTYRLKKILAFKDQVTYASYISKPDFQLLTERYI